MIRVQTAIPTDILIKNSLRWIKSFLFEWTILFSLYLFLLWKAVFPTLEDIFGIGFLKGRGFLFCLGSVLIPFLFSRVWSLSTLALPVPSFGMRNPRILFATNFLRNPLSLIFVASIWSAIYFSGTTNFLSLIFASQWIPQLICYQTDGWRTFLTGSGFEEPSLTLWESILILALVLGVLAVFPLILEPQLIMVFFGGVLGGSVVCLEGDSGRPFLTNLLSYSVGIFSALMMWASPWFFILIFYFAYQARNLSQNRHQSVEGFYEDTVLS